MANTLPYQLQHNKIYPSPQERIEELTRENGRLRQELAFYSKKHTDTVALYTKALKALKALQDALHEIAEKQGMSEKSLLNYWGILVEEFNPEIAIL